MCTERERERDQSAGLTQQYVEWTLYHFFGSDEFYPQLGQPKIWPFSSDQGQRP